MSEEIEEYKNRIAELEKQLEGKADNSFDEIKQKYENLVEEKNKEILELNKTNELLQGKVDETINDLDDEVKTKLKQSEQLAELNKQVEELMHDKAEATVDTFIQQGKILPAQRETALKLAINDNDTFMDLYKDAKPIVDTTPQPRSRKVENLERLVDYFKN